MQNAERLIYEFAKQVGKDDKHSNNIDIWERRTIEEIGSLLKEAHLITEDKDESRVSKYKEKIINFLVKVFSKASNLVLSGGKALKKALSVLGHVSKLLKKLCNKFEKLCAAASSLSLAIVMTGVMSFVDSNAEAAIKYNQKVIPDPIVQVAKTYLNSHAGFSTLPQQQISNAIDILEDLNNLPHDVDISKIQQDDYEVVRKAIDNAYRLLDVDREEFKKFYDVGNKIEASWDKFKSTPKRFDKYKYII